jgi:hypothetical protein
MDGARLGPLPLAGLALPDSENGRLLARALEGRWRVDEAATFDIRLTLDERARDTKLNEAGIGARIELTYVLRAELHHRPKGKTRLMELRHIANVARSDSGADDLIQQRNQARLAMRLLAERFITRLARELPKEPPQ